MKNIKHFLTIFLVSLLILTAFAPFNREAAAKINKTNNFVTAKMEAAFFEKTKASTAVFDIIVQLKNIPLAKYYNKANSGNFIMALTGVKNILEVAATQGIETQQKEFLSFVATQLSNYTLLGATSVAFNGVFLSVKGEEIAKLATSSLVAYIYPSNTYKPLDEYSEEVIGMNSSAWSSLNLGGKYNGTGLKFGVIDTGVDYTHPDLGGDGTTRTFPNAKVVGGYDFADGDADPYPDIVAYGHGTHVAGIIAADGKIKGLAPKAIIYAYKVFGTKNGGGGASDATIIMALDRSIKDGCDVDNLSLGSGDGQTNNPETEAINNATAAGIIVVVAAGNSGPKTPQSEFPIGSPSATLNAIAVAATDDGPYTNIRIVTPSGDATIIEGQYFDASPTYANGRTFSVVDCGYGTVAEIQAAKVTGKIALIQRGPPGDGALYYRDKVLNAKAAGAVGTIIYNHSPGYMNATLIVDVATDANLKFIPSIVVTQGRGLYLKSLTKNGLTLNITADSKKGTMAEFSSMGVTSDFEFKPDVSAPGTFIYSTYMGTTNKYATLSGTSMAAPCVAAVAGLLKKGQPGWTPENIRLALANTSTVLVNPANQAVITWTLQGAGRINVPAAFKTDTFVYTLKNGAIFKYSGLLGQLNTGNFSQSIFINNISTSAKIYNLSFAWTSKYNAGVNYILTPSTLTIGPNATGAAVISFTNTNPKNTSYEGVINIIGGKEALHIPVILWKDAVKGNKQVDNATIAKTVFNPAVDKLDKISFSLGYGSVAVQDGEYAASNLIPDTVMRIYDATGTKILGTIYDKEMLFMGDYEFVWDGRDAAGRWFLADGNYQLRISVLEGNNDTKNLQVEEKDYAVIPLTITGTLASTVFVYPTITGTPKTHWFTVININLSSNLSLSGISGELILDRRLLKYTKVVRGELLGNSSIKLVTNYEAMTGLLTFKVSGNIKGVGTLFAIKVDVLGGGTLNTSLAKLDVRDIFGMGITSGTNDESINISNFTVAWDVNSDRIIDVKDLLAEAKAYGTVMGQAVYCPEADIDQNGSINTYDFAKITKYFGQVYP